MKTPEEYVDGNGPLYCSPESVGWGVIECLPSLIGKPWDQLALNYAHALRPSCIRVTEGMVTCNAVPWRVTIFVDSIGNIRKIEQEVEVGLTGGYEHAHDLRTHAKNGNRR